MGRINKNKCNSLAAKCNGSKVERHMASLVFIMPCFSGYLYSMCSIALCYILQCFFGYTASLCCDHGVATPESMKDTKLLINGKSKFNKMFIQFTF